MANEETKPETTEVAKPEEPKEMTPEEKAQDELLKATTNVAVRTVLVLIASFLKAAVNTKIKDEKGLRSPTGTEVADILFSLLNDAIQNLAAEERRQANGKEN